MADIKILVLFSLKKYKNKLYKIECNHLNMNKNHNIKTCSIKKIFILIFDNIWFAHIYI